MVVGVCLSRVSATVGGGSFEATPERKALFYPFSISVGQEG